jgi:Domain of unknown function (DUF4919)
MKSLAIVFALTLAFGAPAASFAAEAAGRAPLDSKAVAQQKYDAFKAQVLGGNLGIDWRAFRLAAVVAGLGDTTSRHGQRDAIMKSYRAGDYPAALAGAKQLIDQNMAWPEGHLLAVMVYSKMNSVAANPERSILNALVKSIEDSGDGKSPDTAWFTVSVDEEYFFISVVLGAESRSQALVQHGGHSYDQMTIADEGKQRVVWFNTDTDMQMTDAELRGGK